MTIATISRSGRKVRPALFLIAAVVAIGLAGSTARAAFASANVRYLSSSRSLELLRAAFGTAAERPLREPKVVVAPTSAAIWALSDSVNMANGAWNPRTARAWARSDAQAMWPEGLGGFTDPVTGDVYINGHTAVESAMPHELLHANAAPEFLQAVGVALNEGITERLALDALAVSGVKAEKVPAYASYRALAEAVERIAGRDRLIAAYFNGGAQLDALVASIGAETLARLKGAVTGTDTGLAMKILEEATVG